MSSMASTPDDFNDDERDSTAIYEDPAGEVSSEEPLFDPVMEASLAISRELRKRRTPAPLNKVLRLVITEYLRRIDSSMGFRFDVIEEHLLSLTNQAIDCENAKLPKGEAGSKLPRQRFAPAVQMAMAVNHLFHVAEVTPGGTEEDDNLGLLAIYQDSGEFEGLYRRADLGLLDGVAREANFTNDEKWFKEFERALRGFAPKVTETQDTDLVVMRNLIYNYRTDERLPFSPEYVFLSRNSDIDLIDRQHPVPEVLDADGKVIWNYEEWWAETVPSEGSRLYLQQVVGAAFRPSHDWQKMPCLFSESGSNGKGTILEHIRAMIGSRNCASVPLKAYTSEFGKEQLIGKRLNMPDETPVNEFIKDASDLKAIITNDPITINRKHQKPITYKPAMFTVLTLNGTLNFRDKTDSMDRRVAIVPMTQRFGDGVKNKDIKNDYLKRREVCEYMAYKVLAEMPKYWELTEPAEVTQALQEHKRETNSVLAFFEEYKDEFRRPVIPFAMARAVYAAWLKETREGAKPVDAGKFTQELKALFDPSLWIVPQAPDGSDMKLNTANWLKGSERVLNEFSHVPAVSKWQWHEAGYGPKPGLASSVPRQTRGLMRRDVYEAWMAAGAGRGPDEIAAAIRMAGQQRDLTSDTTPDKEA